MTESFVCAEHHDDAQLEAEGACFLACLKRMTGGQLWRYIELVRQWRPQEVSPQEVEFIAVLERYALKRSSRDGMPAA